MAAQVLLRFFTGCCSLILLLIPLKETYASNKSEESIGKIETNEVLDKSFLELEVIAESQSWQQDNIFVAEGNVSIHIQGGTLKADLVEINKLNNTIIAKGNVSFSRGSHFFNASKFKYNLHKNEGNFENVYGVIDVNKISEDITLNEDINALKNLPVKDEEMLGLREVRLRDGFILQGGFDSEMDVVKHPSIGSNSINKWRLKASNIFINHDGLKADKVSITNDPYNPSQIRIDAFKVEFIQGKDSFDSSIITAEKCYLIIEENIRAPIGNRKIRIGQEGEVKQWVLGYESKDRDGFFIGRQLESIKINDSYNLLIQPQYLIQRSIFGKTNSYPEVGKTFNSKKVSNSIELSDLFALDAELKGKLYNWQSSFSADITTLNTKRISNAARLSGSFKKEFDFNRIKDLEATFFGTYREKVWNGSIGSNDIFTSYGLNFDKNYNWDTNNTFYEYNLGIGLGRYTAEKINNKAIISSWIPSLYSNFGFKYSLSKNQLDGQDAYIKSPYSPNLIKNGAYLNSKISTSNYFYEDGKYQSTLSLGFGPEVILGSLKKDYFDYTKISVIPYFTFKSGDSPFKFDNANDLFTLKSDITQQLIGPIIAKVIYEVNIDSNSSNYGKTITSKTALMWQRRAYQVGIFYDAKNDSGGISFRLNGFDFKGRTSSF